jgi:hypothetical protein
LVDSFESVKMHGPTNPKESNLFDYLSIIDEYNKQHSQERLS